MHSPFVVATLNAQFAGQSKPTLVAHFKYTNIKELPLMPYQINSIEGNITNNIHRQPNSNNADPPL